ncbi:hypothetical protein I552_3380 [Mycobacterium xenopi 3993]|nr:hypothetical protein I552_3380 [Mycobacterium xenopi 3993]
MRTVFLGSEALAQGKLTEHELRRWHHAIFRDVYVPSRHQLTLRDRIEGAWLWSRRRAVIAGVAASALHGARWIDDDIPIEVVWNCTRPPAGVIARDETLSDDEVARVAGLPVTSVARTAYDLGRHLPRQRAVARLDALMHATPFSVEDVLLLATRHRGHGFAHVACGAAGCRRRRRVAEGNLAAAAVDRRRLAHPDHPNTRARRLPAGGIRRHGLGQLQGGGRVRRRPPST